MPLYVVAVVAGCTVAVALFVDGSCDFVSRQSYSFIVQISFGRSI